MSHELKNIIVERQFELRDAEGRLQEIHLRIGKPFEISESSHSLMWRCPFQITGLGLERVKEAPGIDSVDSLLMALKIAEAWLITSVRDHAEKLTWLGEKDLGLSTLSVNFDQTEPTSESGDSVFKKTFDTFFHDGDFGDLLPKQSRDED